MKKKTAKKKTSKKTAKSSSRGGRPATRKTPGKKPASKKKAPKKTAKHAGAADGSKKASSAGKPGDKTNASVESRAAAAPRSRTAVAAPASGSVRRHKKADEVGLRHPCADLIVKVGIDLGTRRTAIAASKGGARVELKEECIDTVISWPRGAHGAAPSGDVLYGAEALRQREHVELRWPLSDGAIVDLDACRKFVKHVAQIIDPGRKEKLWGVVSSPVGTAEDQKRLVRQAMQNVLERIAVVPEPCLAIAGLRREGALTGTLAADSPHRALVVDIGHDYTSVSLARVEPPAVQRSVRLDKASDFIDEEILLAARTRFPGVRLTRELVRSIKEEQATVRGEAAQTGGPSPSELVALADVMRAACDNLLSLIGEVLERLLDGCEPEVADELTRTVVVTGGGSRIRGIGQRLEDVLRAKGWKLAHTIIAADHRRLVATGALELAETMSLERWESMSPVAAFSSPAPSSVESFFAEAADLGRKIEQTGLFRHIFPES